MVKQKSKKKLRVHSLTGRITPDLMEKAFKAVKANRGTVGVDKVSIEMFEANLDQNLAKLLRQLKDRSYQPIPLKRVMIPKGTEKNSKSRPLGIPTVRCRIAQEVVRQLINSTFEKIFHPHSYGFRERRNGHQAIQQVLTYIQEGYNVVVDVDIKGFFDNISHDLINQKVQTEIADGNILGLINKFLKSGVMEHGVLKPTVKGTPQGGVISPLLANIVLNHLDWKLHEAGYKFVRYADDFVVLCKSMQQAEQALDFVTAIVEGQLALTLSPEKTKLNKAKYGFDFLGFRIAWRSIQMRQKSEKNFKMKIRYITKRHHNFDKTVIEKLNRVIRGTLNYFGPIFATSGTKFRNLDQWIRKRIRCMKLKRISREDNEKIRTKVIHEDMGLKSCWQLYLAAQGFERIPKIGVITRRRPVRESRTPVNIEN